MQTFAEYETLLIQELGSTRKFLVLSVQTDGSNFFLFERWGRSPLEGQSTRQEYTRDQAIEKFRQKFFEKTGYQWCQPPLTLEKNCMYKVVMDK